MFNTWWLFNLLLFSLLAKTFEAFIDEKLLFEHITKFFNTVFINVTFTDSATGEFRFKNYEASKIKTGDMKPTTGVVVHVKDVNSGDVYDGLKHWIALIQYENCSDAAKIRLAADKNAEIIVIYSSLSFYHFIKHHLKIFPVASAVLISMKNGIEIASLMNSDTKVLMHIFLGRHQISLRYFFKGKFSWIPFLYLFVVIIFFIALLLVSYTIFLSFRTNISSKRFRKAAKKALTKIPTIKLRQSDLDINKDLETCAICIESFKLDEIVRTLSCKHMFHKCCIDPWLLKKGSCPMCKKNIFLGGTNLVSSVNQNDFLNIRQFAFCLWCSNIEDEITDINNPRLSLNQPTELNDEITTRCSLQPLNVESDITASSLFTLRQSSNEVEETRRHGYSDDCKEIQTSECRLGLCLYAKSRK